MKDIDEATIRGEDFEGWIQEYIPTYLELLKNIGISPPILIMVSLLKARGNKIGAVLAVIPVVSFLAATENDWSGSLTGFK